MSPFGTIQYKKQGESLFKVIYMWKDTTFMTAQVFTKTEAGAIAKTFPLAVACGFGVDPDTHEVVKHYHVSSLEGHTVETNAFKRLKSNRTLKANEKRDVLVKIGKELHPSLCFDPKEIESLGRIIR